MKPVKAGTANMLVLLLTEKVQDPTRPGEFDTRRMVEELLREGTFSPQSVCVFIDSAIRMGDARFARHLAQTFREEGRLTRRELVLLASVKLGIGTDDVERMLKME